MWCRRQWKLNIFAETKKHTQESRPKQMHQRALSIWFYLKTISKAEWLQWLRSWFWPIICFPCLILIFSRSVPACLVSSIGGWLSPGRAPAPGCRCVWRRSGWDPDPLRWRAAALAECCLPALSPQPERRRKRKKVVCHWQFDWLTPSMNY